MDDTARSDAVRGWEEIGALSAAPRALGPGRPTRMHPGIRDTSTPAAQYVAHSDLGKVQARSPWAKPSILYGQVCARPPPSRERSRAARAAAR